MINKILVPVDGSSQSNKALELACNLADKYHATLHLQHTVQTAALDGDRFVDAADMSLERNDEDILKTGKNVMRAAKRIVDQHHCPTMVTEIALGSPTENILRRSKEGDIDMIVMGSRGLGDRDGLLLGSVSQQVSHFAECSCVTVR